MSINFISNRKAHDYIQRFHHCDRRIQTLNVDRREMIDKKRTNDVRFNLDVTHQLEQMRNYEDSWGDLLPPSRYVASDSDNT